MGREERSREENASIIGIDHKINMHYRNLYSSTLKTCLSNLKSNLGQFSRSVRLDGK